MSSAVQNGTSQLRTVTQIAFLGAVAASLSLGCVSSSSDNTGAGGSQGGAGGTPGAGGAAGGITSVPDASAAAGGASLTVSPCLQITAPLITDFSTAADAGTAASQASFGDFKTTFSGGTYTYPDPTATAPGLTSDISRNNWHISGTVANYSGFGLYFSVSYGKACALFDASAFKGISMTISGSVPAGDLIMNVGTVEDTISTAWSVANESPPTASLGTCSPPGSNKYDGTCASPSVNIPVTATPTPVKILWADLTGGKPNASVTSSQLTGIAFYFNWSTGSYPVDVTIDDLSFIP